MHVLHTLDCSQQSVLVDGWSSSCVCVQVCDQCTGTAPIENDHRHIPDPTFHTFRFSDEWMATDAGYVS